MKGRELLLLPEDGGKATDISGLEEDLHRAIWWSRVSGQVGYLSCTQQPIRKDAMRFWSPRWVFRAEEQSAWGPLGYSKYCQQHIFNISVIDGKEEGSFLTDEISFKQEMLCLSGKIYSSQIGKTLKESAIFFPAYSLLSFLWGKNLGTWSCPSGDYAVRASLGIKYRLFLP